MYAILNIVNEVKERINALDIDGIMEPGELAELITERTVTLFPDSEHRAA